MKSKLKNTTAQYYIDYLNNSKDGISILELKTLQVPLAYKIFLEEGARKTYYRSSSEFVTLLILKYYLNRTGKDLLNDLKKYREQEYSVYEEGQPVEEIQRIYIPIDLFELLLGEKPHLKEESLKNMLEVILPRYVSTIIHYYYTKALEGETL
jgi:hypothetical protein